MANWPPDTNCSQIVSSFRFFIRLHFYFCDKKQNKKNNKKMWLGSINSDKAHDIYFMTAASLSGPPCAAHAEGQICELVCSSLPCLPPHPPTAAARPLQTPAVSARTASSPQPALLIHLCRCCLLFRLVFLTSLCLERPDSTFKV